MSIVFINNSSETFTRTRSGAIATVIHESCLAMKAAGREPLVISRSDNAALLPWDRTKCIEYPPVPADRLGTLLCRVDRKLTGWRYFRQRQWAARVVNALRESGAHKMPLVLSNDPELACVIRNHFPHADITHWFHNQHDAREKFRACFAASVTRVAAVSSFIARWAENFYQLPADSVHVVHNGVNLEAFHPESVHAVKRPIINFTGRTGIEKAPDLLLKACVKLSKQTQNFAVQILGANHWGRLELDDYQRELASLAGELERAGIEVRRPGHIDRDAMPGEMRRAHIHVVPSRWDEPFGLVTLEGMATGLATVASATGGTPEVVGDAALLFPREDVHALAGHLGRLIDHPDFRRTQAAKARRRAEEFTWEKTAHAIMRLTTAPAAHEADRKLKETEPAVFNGGIKAGAR